MTHALVFDEYTLVNLDELREIEARAAHRFGEFALMERAGKAAANYIQTHFNPTHVAILVGPGNNGGDGLLCALYLQGQGIQTSVVIPGQAPKAAFLEDTLQSLKASGCRVVSDPYDVTGCDVVVDALFGVGLSRPITGSYYEAVQWFNERHAHKIALDIPSGLDSQTGNTIGPLPGIRAHVTLTFLAPKPGLFMRDGVDVAGRVVVDNLQTSIALTRLTLNHPGLFSQALAARRSNTHKGHYGHVAVVGGAHGMVGAAWLSASAALKMGAGRVSIMLQDKTAATFNPVWPEIMSAPTSFGDRYDVYVVGPGLGTDEHAREIVEQALASDKPLVLDADALVVISQHMALQNQLLARTAPTVLTPHEMEAAKLLRCDLQRVLNDRVNASRELAVQTGAMVVLKGPGSVISLRTAVSWVNPTGSSHLATAGSGDVLAGMIAGLMAQDIDRVHATLAAVYVHGLAGQTDELLRASDIIQAASHALVELRREHQG